MLERHTNMLRGQLAGGGQVHRIMVERRLEPLTT